MRCNRSLVQLQQSGNLLVAQLTKEPERHDLLLPLRKRSDQVTKLGQEFLTRQGIGGQCVGGAKIGQRLWSNRLEWPISSAIEAGHGIVGDSKQPRRKRSLSLPPEAGQRFHCLQERFRSQVLDILDPAYPVTDVRIDPWKVVMVELAEGVRVAARSGYEALFAL